MINQSALVCDSDYYENNLCGISWWGKLILWYALLVAQLMHFGQVRRSGHRYIEHCQAVANLLRVMGLPISTQAAALLHDVIEENKGIRRLIAILLVLLTGPLIAGMVLVLTKWSDDEEAYFNQILRWSWLFRYLPAIKLADKRTVLGTPLLRSKEKTIATMQKVLPNGSFAFLIEKSRKYISSRIIIKYDELFKIVQKEALTQLIEAQNS